MFKIYLMMLLQLSEYLVRLARALCWSECTSPPAHGNDTTILAETLLERAERLSVHHDNHIHGIYDKHHDNHHAHTMPHHHHSLKLRRERSCHDLPLKEVLAIHLVFVSLPFVLCIFFSFYLKKKLFDFCV